MAKLSLGGDAKYRVIKLFELELEDFKKKLYLLKDIYVFGGNY